MSVSRTQALTLTSIATAVRSGFQGALDGLSDTAKAAFLAVVGSRRLLKTYPKTGPLMRVRRGSDNAEADFGPMSDGWPDAQALGTYAGTGVLFGVTGYDQRVDTIEERRNWWNRSQDFSNTAWGKVRGDVTVNGDGSHRFTANAGAAGENSLSQSLKSLTASTTQQWWVKKGNTDWCSVLLWDNASNVVRQWFNLATLTVGSTTQTGTLVSISSPSTISMDGDWIKLTVTASHPALTVVSVGRLQIVRADGAFASFVGDYIDVLRAQAEAGPATTYQQVDAGTEYPKRYVGGVLDSHDFTQTTTTAQPRLAVWPQEEAPVYQWAPAQGVSDWVPSSGATVTLVDGKIRVTDVPSGAVGRASLSLPTEIGKAYRVFVNPTGGSAGLGQVYASLNDSYGTNLGGTNGINDFVFVATATTTKILLVPGADDGRWCEWDTVRITPAYTEGNRVALSAMTTAGSTTVDATAGTITINQPDDSFAGATMTFPGVTLDEGALYEVSVDCSSYTSGRFQLYSSNGTTPVVYTSAINSVGTYRFYVRMVAGQTTINVARWGGVASTHQATFRNLICRKIIGSRRNLLTHSDRIDRVEYAKIGGTVSGTDVFVENSTAATQHRLLRDINAVSDQSTPASANRVFSVQAKVKRVTGNRHFQFGLTYNSNAARIYYDLDAGTVAATGSTTGQPLPTGSIELLPSGEWLCKATAQAATTGTAYLYLAVTNTPTLGAETYTGDGVSSMSITDIQYEFGSVCTAYQRVGADSARGVLCYEANKKHVASWNFDGAQYFERPASDFPSNLHTLPEVGDNLNAGANNSTFDTGTGNWIFSSTQAGASFTTVGGVAQITGVSDYIGKAIRNVGGLLGKNVIASLDVWSSAGGVTVMLQNPASPFTTYVSTVVDSRTPRRVQLVVPNCPVSSLLVIVIPWTSNPAQVVSFDNVTVRELDPAASPGITVALRIDPLFSGVASLWAMRDNSTGFIGIARNANGTLSIEHRSDANVHRNGNTLASVGVGSSGVIVFRWDFLNGRCVTRVNGVQQMVFTGIDLAGGLTARRHLIGATRPGASVTAFYTGYLSEPIIIKSYASDDECVILENALKEGIK